MVSARESSTAYPYDDLYTWCMCGDVYTWCMCGDVYTWCMCGRAYADMGHARMSVVSCEETYTVQECGYTDGVT